MRLNRKNDSIYRIYETLSPIYKGGLTNHLPMMLYVLEYHNVDKEIILEKLNEYTKTRGIYDLSENTTPISDFEQAYINRTSYYLGEINRKGVDVVVGEMLNKHRYAFASALFHGIIRLMYALKTKEDIQVAQALAYFEVSSQEIKLDGVYVKPGKMNEFIEHMRTTVAGLEITFPSNRTMDKIETLISNDTVKNLLFKVEEGLIKREDIIDILLNKYLETEDFYVLHLITGFHALLELEEFYINFDEMLVQYLLISEVIMLLDTSKTEYAKTAPLSLYDCVDKIAMFDDAHDVKLLHSIYELSKYVENDKIILVANTLFEANLE